MIIIESSPSKKTIPKTHENRIIWFVVSFFYVMSTLIFPVLRKSRLWRQIVPRPISVVPVYKTSHERIYEVVLDYVQRQDYFSRLLREITNDYNFSNCRLLLFFVSNKICILCNRMYIYLVNICKMEGLQTFRV